MVDMYTRFVAKVAEQQEVTDEGKFSAIVSAFDVLDSQGDVVDRGAFAEAVERVNGGEILPAVWSHHYQDPFSIIGELNQLEEVDKGLRVEGQLDIADNPLAAHVFRQMKRGRLKEFSIGGEIVEWYWAEAQEGQPEAFHIKKLDLWEAGPCFKGANPNTELLSIKSRLRGEAADPKQAQPVQPIRLSFHQRASIHLQAMRLNS